MAITKRGDITDQTPPEIKQFVARDKGCCSSCGCKPPATKQAADRLEDHPSTRAAEAVADAARKP